MRRAIFSALTILFLLCAVTPVWSLTKTREFAIADGMMGFVGSFDGTNYLVGLQDTSLGEAGSPVYAQFISRTGAKVGEPITNGRTGSFPFVVFDGTNHLLVWADDESYPNDDIYGQLVSTSGEPVTEAFPISPAQGHDSRPMVAYGGGQYLVAWTDRSSDNPRVRGQLVSTDGTLTGDPIEISVAVGKDPWVAFDGTNFLVVWNNKGSIVLGHFISTGGEKLAGPITIDASSAESEDPTYLIYDGTRYVASIPDFVAGDTWRYFARTISKAGQVSTSRIRLDNGNSTGPFGGIVGFDGTHYLVVVRNGGAAPLIMARFVDRSFKPVDAWTTLFATVNSKSPVACTLAFDGRRYFALAPRATQAGTDSGTYGMIIQPLNAPSLTSFKINAGAASATSRSVRLNNTATGGPTQFMASESPDFTGAVWTPYSTSPSFVLSAGSGAKTIYFKVKNRFGESFVRSDSISFVAKPSVTGFAINDGAAGTTSRSVTLDCTVAHNPTHYMASEVPTFAGAIWKTWRPNPAFQLSPAFGNKTVYLKVKNAAGESRAVSDSIRLQRAVPSVTGF